MPTFSRRLRSLIGPAALCAGVVSQTPALALTYSENFEGPRTANTAAATATAFKWYGQQNGTSFPGQLQTFNTVPTNSAIFYTPQVNGVSVWTDAISPLNIAIGDVRTIDFDLRSGSVTQQGVVMRDPTSWRLMLRVGSDWYLSSDKLGDNAADDLFTSLTFNVPSITGWVNGQSNTECTTGPCGIRLGSTSLSLPSIGMLTGFGFFNDALSMNGNQRFDNITLTAVPLPAAGLMLAGAIGAFAALRRRS
jgi:hypothetical protein